MATILIVSPKRIFQITLRLSHVLLAWVDHTLCQNPVAILLRRFLDLCIFGVLVGLKNNFLLSIVDRCSSINPEVEAFIVTLGRIEALAFSGVFGFLVNLGPWNAVDEFANRFDGDWHLWSVSIFP